ncbi:MAG TPA: HD domain-containing phosphohydrolase, partial [Geobacteraceae bacterium]
MNEAVLFVDDEEYVLSSVERVFADSELCVLRANCAARALEIVRAEEIAVLVSDNLMPEIKGVELLARVKRLSPQTVKILMTGHADIPTAIDAINRGEVFRFIVKPWDNAALLSTVMEGVERYRVLKSLRSYDEAITRSLAQTIELKDPYTRGHCDRVANYALLMARTLLLSPEMQKGIMHGSWLHDCGKIGVPEAILNSPNSLTAQEWETIRKHPEWGADVARQAQLPQSVVNVIMFHHERWDGGGYPSGAAGIDIPLEARIVTVADVYDAMTSDRPYRKALPRVEARTILASQAGKMFDPQL